MNKWRKNFEQTQTLVFGCEINIAELLTISVFIDFHRRAQKTQKSLTTSQVQNHPPLTLTVKLSKAVSMRSLSFHKMPAIRDVIFQLKLIAMVFFCRSRTFERFWEKNSTWLWWTSQIPKRNLRAATCFSPVRNSSSEFLSSPMKRERGQLPTLSRNSLAFQSGWVELKFSWMFSNFPSLNVWQFL